MQSTLNENAGATHSEAVQNPAALGSRAITDLIADVQDLLGQMAHVADPEIARLGKKVEMALATARKAIADGSGQVQRRARDAAKASNRYVHENPWQSIGVAALAGIILGFLVSRR